MTCPVCEKWPVAWLRFFPDGSSVEVCDYCRAQAAKYRANVTHARLDTRVVTVRTGSYL